MIKKLVCFALAVATLGLPSLTIASSPSITLEALSPPSPEDAYIHEIRMSELARIDGFVKSGRPVVEYFQPALASASEGINPGAFVLAEFIAYDLCCRCCDVFHFPTVTEDAKVIAFLGVVNADETITWIQVRACVLNGAIFICFMRCALALAPGTRTLLAILLAV